MDTASRTGRLRRIAQKASVDLLDSNAEEALSWVVRTFGESWIVASSMQDAVLIDLAARAKADAKILFLDTGYHFQETIGVRDALSAAYPDIRIVNVQAKQSVAEQEAEFGTLYRTDPDKCCFLRKVLPLQQALAPYDCWVTGVRRADGPTRTDTPIAQWDDRYNLVKVNPLATWTDDQFNDYIAEHGILQNPLVNEGYLSIGCWPCTAKPLPGQGARSGRWIGHSKNECGLHG